MNPTLQGLSAGIRWHMRHLFTQQAMILVYHRIADCPVNRWSLCTSPDRFERHLSMLRLYARPVPVSQFVSEMMAGVLQKGSVAITFDDGYADNFHTALPIMRRYGITGAFYLVGKAIGSGREFWWDELERCVFESKQLPSHLSLVLGDRPIDVDVNSEPDAREALFDALWRRCQALSDEAKQAVLDALVGWSGVSSEPRASHIPLNEAEVVEMGRDSLVEIGAHTDTHPRLAALTAEQKRIEVTAGAARLEALLGKAISGFAYPFGHPNDYGAESVALLQSLGFRYALRVGGRIPRRSPDPFQVPRVYMTNQDGGMFARLMHERLGIRV